MTVRVLVVDDDFRVASVHASVAARVSGCEVVGEATTLAQARSLLAEGVDLIIADEYLPDGSGADLIGAADAAVLLVTASDDHTTVRRALVRGAIGYVVKPFGLKLLADRVADFVRFSEALDAPGPRDQATIDGLVRMAGPRAPQLAQPKGRSAVTATAVAEVVREASGPVTAVVVAEAIGVSRATAQRYLADLVDSGAVELGLHYRSAGRPEHHYTWAR